jgi:hypothetical protein
MVMRQNLWIALASAGLVSACSLGGQTGDEFTANEGSQDCDETYRPIDDPDAMTDLGFNAAEILAFANREFQSDLRWNAIGRVEYLPGPGETTLTLGFTAGDVSFVERNELSRDGTHTEEVRDPCDDELAIGVELRVTTADGALDEMFETELRAATKSWATVDLPLDLDALEGSFEVVSVTESERAEPGAAQIVQPTLRAALSPFGTRGEFDAVLEERTSNTVSGGWARFAEWPSASPCADGLPAGLGESPSGPSALALLESLEAAPAIAWQWQDGAVTTLALSFVPTSQEYCVFQSLEAGLSSSLATELTLTSEDGRISGPLPVDVMWGPGSEEGTTQVRARLASSATFTTEAVATLFPELAAELDDYDGVRLTFFVAFLVDEDGEATATETSIELFGGMQSACDVPGPCPGIQETAVERGEQLP